MNCMGLVLQVLLGNVTFYYLGLYIFVVEQSGDVEVGQHAALGAPTRADRHCSLCLDTHLVLRVVAFEHLPRLHFAGAGVERRCEV